MDLSGFEGADISGMVSKLVEDPELLSGLASALGLGGGGEKDPARETRQTGNANTDAGIPADAADVLGSLLSMVGDAGGKSGKKETDRIGHGGKKDAGGSKSAFRDAAKRTALLSALKPYCNPHRQQTIDRMISISKLSGTLQKLDLSGKRG